MSLTPKTHRSTPWIGISFLEAAGGLFASVLGGSVTLEIHPRKTHPVIKKDARFHVVMIDPAVAARNKLFLFLPGIPPDSKPWH